MGERSVYMNDVLDGSYLPTDDLVRYATATCRFGELEKLSASMHEIIERWKITAAVLDLDLEVRAMLESELERIGR
jgi:hypothetical protein